MAAVRRIPVAVVLVHKPGTRLQLGVRKLGSVMDHKRSFTMYDVFLVGPHLQTWRRCEISKLCSKSLMCTDSILNKFFTEV